MHENDGRRPSELEIVAIGASTGGPVPIRTILSGLPVGFPVPVVIVQHISKGFSPRFVEWLAGATSLSVHLGSDGQRIEAGHVYVAPDGIHMGVGPGSRIYLSSADPEHGVRPAVSFLFRSIMKTYGGNAVGVLLSGMGMDGAEELRDMRDQGAITFAQDKGTCVVFGMPGEAVKLGAAMHVMPPDRICNALSELVTQA
jgi:two-component system, chemotaxis family, protein-glutamate methylesterase/glutaminase